jgi:uncharacterized caspase-like protein
MRYLCLLLAVPALSSAPLHADPASLSARTPTALPAPMTARLSPFAGKPRLALLRGPRPRLFLLAVGINAYPGKNRLRFAVKDATDLERLFHAKGGPVFQGVESKLLVNQQAHRAGVLEGIDWLRERMTPNDVAVFFYSGHGARSPRAGFHLVPAGYKDEMPRLTGLPGVELKQALAQVPGRVLLILDCCFSGAILNQGDSLAESMMADLGKSRPSLMVMCASRAGETADETGSVRHGLFTKALLEGMAGRADANHDGLVEVRELEQYVGRRVKRLSKNKQHVRISRPAELEALVLTKP